MPPFEPRPYQLAGRDFLAGRKTALLADEMRVGKTPQAILAAHKTGAQSVLVTCPAIAVPHWHREFEKWWPSGPLPRLAIWSYDKARGLWESGQRGMVDVFIPDEAHFAKNPEAKRTRMVYGKTGFGSQAGALWPLSGTPVPRHAGELWPMLRAFGATKMSYYEFVNYFCTMGMNLMPTGTKEKHIPELRAILATVMLRRTRKEVAPDMPDIGFEFTEVDLEKLPAYQLPPGLSDDALVEWLARNSHVDRENRIEVAKAKARVLAREIVDSIEGGLYKQTVVFGWHREPLLQLHHDLFEAGVTSACLMGGVSEANREAIQSSFRSGAIKVVCANIAAAGTAIDLSAASHGYFVEMDWVPGSNTQAANRLVSMDKQEPVTFDVLTCPGTTDDRVQRVLVRRVRELSQLL